MIDLYTKKPLCLYIVFCVQMNYFANVASVGEVAKLLLVVILETRDKN